MEVAVKRILVVDDDAGLRGVLKNILESAGYGVAVAQGGREASSMVGSEKFDGVVSDIRMPDGDGLSLVRFLRENQPNLPIVLMTGFAELSETQEAHHFGADEFIAKPFEKAELLKALDACLAGESVPAESRSAEEYCKISLNDFVCGKAVHCDLFIRLGESKFIKIAHRGEEMPPERIDKYKKKHIPHLYMLKSDLALYLEFNMKLVDAVKTSKKIPSEQKIRFMKHTVDVVMERLHSQDIDEECFEHAKTVLENTISLLSEDSAAFGLLEMLNGHSDYLYAHSLGVSVYSTMIARQLDWNSPQTIYKLSVGGLLHDIGKKEIDPAILVKSRMHMTVAELHIYESHCTRGLEILGHVQSIPSDILQIVLQHHENHLGQGFPQGLGNEKIHPLARVVAVADAFCGLCLKSPTSAGMSPHDALARLKAVYAATLDPVMLEGLEKVLKGNAPVNRVVA